MTGRFYNHFNNPLLSWEQAGLDRYNIVPTPFPSLVYLSGESSLLWAQNETNNEWSWQKVRDYYKLALTTSTDDQREANFAKTFKGLGHIIHLIQDSAQPAHTRNDPHPLDGLGIIKGFEWWTFKNAIELNLYDIPPDFPTVSLDTSVGGYIPITQFWDTDQYDGANPPAGSNIGISEYTNANFFSEDTINASNFPYPQINQSTPVVEGEFTNTLWNTTYQRQYYLKDCCGETNGGQGYLLSAVDYLDYYRQEYPLLSFALPQIPVLDNNVYADYASLLLPRAIGYSAGLLNYFFRGEIDLVPDEELGYGYMIENKTEEDMEGTFELFYDNSSNERITIWSSNFYLGTASSGNNKSSNFEFIVPDDAKDPGKYILVFKGRLGNETDAVVGKIWSSLCGEFKLTTSDAAYDDRFGRSVAISGDVAVVGAYANDDAGSYSGSAYVFVRNGNTWEEQVKLTASDAARNDHFGYSVAISGDVVIVGAYSNDHGITNSGAAYIFVRNGNTWGQQAKLTASDAAAGDQFGFSVGISGDSAIVGALRDDDGGTSSGSAYIFVRNGNTWGQQAKLTANDAAVGDEFGYSVAISGDVAIVGANDDDDDGSRSGSAYIFERNGNTWGQQAKLTASDAAQYDEFGFPVAIGGDVAVVGAYSNDDSGSSSGSAYVFERNGGTWEEQAKLTASDAASGDRFGYSVAISEDVVLIGSYMDDDAGSSSGSAYIFARNDLGMWEEHAKFGASDAAPSRRFGYSVAISGDMAIVAAYGDDAAGPWSGSAYVYCNLQ